MAEYVSVDEYTLLQRGLFFDRSPARLQHGRLYIKPNDLAKWRETYRKAKPHRVFPPQPGLLPLRAFGGTATEHNRLLRAARSGSLPTKKTGKVYFASREDVDAFLSNLSKKEGIAPSGIIFQEQS